MKNDNESPIFRCGRCSRSTKEVQYFSKRQLKRAATGDAKARCIDCIPGAIKQGESDCGDGGAEKQGNQSNKDNITSSLNQQKKNIGSKKNAKKIKKEDVLTTKSSVPSAVQVNPNQVDESNKVKITSLNQLRKNIDTKSLNQTKKIIDIKKLNQQKKNIGIKKNAKKLRKKMS